MVPSLVSISSAMKRKGYILFEDDSKNYNLNIIGVRSSDNTPNLFNDWITVSWKYSGRWYYRVFPATTDPGLFWLRYPQANLGTAILKPGQWKKMWAIGYHKGYKALTQINPVTVIRDFDRDNQLDYDSGREESGIFGINCHRASDKIVSTQVDKWSAGCQVLQNRIVSNPDNPKVTIREFDYFLSLCEQASVNWGSSFTYTLLLESEL